MKEMELSMGSHDSLMRNIINAYQNRTPSTGEEEGTSITGTQQGRPIDLLRYASPDRICIEQATAKEGRDRRKRKMQERCQQ